MRIGMLIFPEMTQLDFTGPWEVFAQLPDCEVRVVAESLEPVTASLNTTPSPLSSAGIPRPLIPESWIICAVNWRLCKTNGWRSPNGPPSSIAFERN